MTRNEAFDLIGQALEKVEPGSSGKLTMETDLLAEGILDSLASMNFLFELETLLGHSISAIDETFDDFRVATLIDLMGAEQA